MSASKLKQRLLSYLPEFMWPNQCVYNDINTLINQTENWNKEKIKAWQFKQLQDLINYTWINSKGYREHWIKHEFSPSQLLSMKDIEKIPFITKEIIQKDIESFSIHNNKSKYKVSTGGSTGIPFSFYNSKKFRAIEDSFINSLWAQFFPSISRKTARTIIRGGVIKDNLSYDPLFGLRLSSRNVTAEMVKSFIIAIDKYKTPILHVYPSSLYIIAKVMIEHDIQRPSHKFNVICFGSEPLYQFQIETIKSVFDEPRCFWYGSTEKVVLAGNCTKNDAFHVYPQYGITEVLDKNNKAAEAGKLGEIIGTSFWGRDTPFIRYKTGDMALVGDDICNSCGREYQLLKRIEGRVQEFVVGSDGNLLSMTYVNSHDDIFESIRQFRFKQTKVGIIEFLFIRKKGKQPDIDKIIKRLNITFGPYYELIPKEVTEIPLTKAGKMSFLEQSLNIQDYI